MPYFTNRSGNALYYEERGSGAPLVMVAGAMVDADFFTETALLLARRYRVITYDRRGYSRSESGREYGLMAQATDIADLLDALQLAQITLLGCSVGGVIALTFASHWPSRVSRLILHEPPVLGLCEVTTEAEKQWLQNVAQWCEKGKYHRALSEYFTGLPGNGQDPRTRPYTDEQVERQLKNGLVFIKEEFKGSFFSDSTAILSENLARIPELYAMVGDSSGDTYAARATKALAELLHRPLLYCAGSHNAAHDLPMEFAAAVAGMIELHPTKV